MALLIFPSSVEASIESLRSAKKWNQKVVGASSLDKDPNSHLFDSWEKLPFINEDYFTSALSNIIKQYGITSIFTPHAPSYLHLMEIKNLLPNINIVGGSPYENQMSLIREIEDKSRNYLKNLSESIGPNNPQLNNSFVASLLSRASTIYGECNEQKIMGLCYALSQAPKGDVIEIGSFFGKSAFVLNRLATKFRIGTTLAVDPWDMASSIQYDSPSTIQKLSSVWDWELVFQGFLLNMQTSHAPPFNYIRATSENAYKTYSSSSLINSLEFGSTELSGKIAVLHLDGNHDQKEISKDFQMWSQHLANGAWLIFDDFNWSQGTGPKSIVEQMKREWDDKIMQEFIAGGAAFFKIRN